MAALKAAYLQRIVLITPYFAEVVAAERVFFEVGGLKVLAQAGVHPPRI